MTPDRIARLEDGIDEALGRGEILRAEHLARAYREEAEATEDRSAAGPRFRSRWLAARVSLDAGRLAEAGRLLNLLLPLPADVPEALACRIRLAIAEVLARRGEKVAAREHLARALASREVLASRPLLRLRQLRILLWLGEVPEAELAAWKAENAEDRYHLTLLSCDEGRAREAAGRLDQAEACWQMAERLAEGDPVCLADVRLQQGRLHHLRGHLQAALDAFESARHLSPLPVQQREAALRRILVLLDLNQQGQAVGAWEQLRLSPETEEPEEVRPLVRMVAGVLSGELPAGEAGLETLAWRAVTRGELEEARRLYEAGQGTAAGDARRARFALALGMLALAVGEVSEARRWLPIAEQLARTEDLPEVLWRALQARGQLAAEIDGEEEQARALFEEAVLVSEGQNRQLRHRVDAMTHGLRRSDLLRRLLLAAARRGDAAGVFRIQELERGRLLLELWRAAPAGRAGKRVNDPRLDEVERLWAELAETGEAASPQGEQLLLERDRLLDAYLRDRSRAETSALPRLPELGDLQKAIPEGTVYLAPSVLDDELHVLVCSSDAAPRVVRGNGSARRMVAEIECLRRTLESQLVRYATGFPLGNVERRELDERLDALGAGCLGDILGRVLDDRESSLKRILWVPDGPLHGVPLAAIRRGGRYLVETHEITVTFGGALLVQQAGRPGRRPWFPRALVLSESPEVLPAAEREGAGVAATFWRGRHLRGREASVDALRRHLRSASVVHFACHAWFDARSPLSARVGLPSGETWRALDWLDEPLDGLPLVTLSACRSAEVGTLAGREVFGLVTGLLAAGVRSVLAGLWPIADREALPFMWSLYRHRLTEDLPAALALAQREAAVSASGSPLFWGAFALFGDPGALAAPRSIRRWLARWLQSRHARRFSTRESRS